MNDETTSDKKVDQNLNPDPITGEPGSHPVGTGLGAAGGAATGAAIGAAGGPIGMAVGGVIGAVAGGVAGHALAETMDPTAEDEYWSQNYKDEPYYDEDYDYEDYQPAYRSGYQSYWSQKGGTFEDSEAELSRDWDEKHRGESRLQWDEARHAAKAGWTRVERSHVGE